MQLDQIDHVAIAVHDLDAAIDYYQQAFGSQVTHREVVERDGVEEALIPVGESYIQLTTGTRPDSPVSIFLDRHGEGIHHIGYRVKNCAEAIKAVVAAGSKAIDETPRPGSRGTTVAFIHPKGALGTLIELVEDPSE